MIQYGTIKVPNAGNNTTIIFPKAFSQILCAVGSRAETSGRESSGGLYSYDNTTITASSRWGGDNSSGVLCVSFIAIGIV